MTLRIEKVSDGQVVILRLSGRLQSEHVEELRTHIRGPAPPVVVDLEQVKLVARDVVCFFAACEATGIHLNHCSPYIREWINRERAG